MEIALKYKVKQSKNGKFPSNYKASPIDLKCKFPSIFGGAAPPNISPSKRAFEKHKPQGLFSEFCGTFKILTCDFIKRNSEQEELHYVKKSYMHILFLLLPYNLLFIFMGMRAPD